MGNEIVMIVGSGAREHRLGLDYLKSDYVKEVIVTPGNDGMHRDGIKTVKGTSLTDANSFLKVAEEYKPSFVDVAQDDALAAGTVDLLTENGFRVFGPTKKAARIEWDKSWSRNFMKRWGISAPEWKVFDKEDSLCIDYAAFLLEKNEAVFFKAAGLYAGKGVIPAFDLDSALKAYHDIKNMGSASDFFLIEEGMVGEEFSVYAMVDGKNYVVFKSAQDNKRAFNDDKGPNTGGMGANSPALVTSGLEKRIVDEIIEPTVNGMAEEGNPYQGIIYFGGMKCDDGTIKVVEFNSRWGDPEVQVITPGVQNDYFELVDLAVDGKLNYVELKEDNLSRVCIIGASKGYPGKYKKGLKLDIDFDRFPEGVQFLSAGIKIEDGQMLTTGGRVFNLIGEGENVIVGRDKALEAMQYCKVEGNKLHYRTDIAYRDVNRLVK